MRTIRRWRDRAPSARRDPAHEYRISSEERREPAPPEERRAPAGQFREISDNTSNSTRSSYPSDNGRGAKCGQQFSRKSAYAFSPPPPSALPERSRSRVSTHSVSPRGERLRGDRPISSCVIGSDSTRRPSENRISFPDTLLLQELP